MSLLLAFDAHAADKAACVAAAENGQQLKNGGKLVDARKQFLVCARADCPPAVSQDCVKWLSETEGAIGALTIKPMDADGRPLDGAHVTVDGVERTSADVELDPGRHTVSVERGGYQRSESTVDIASGEHRELEMRLASVATLVVPETPKPSSGGFSVPALSWILAGVGVVGMAGFAIFGAMGLSDQDNLRKTCAPFCTSSQVSPVSTKFAVADTALVVGLTALAASVIVAIVWPRAPKTALTQILVY